MDERLPAAELAALAEWRAERLRQALADVAELATGEARKLALQALDADALGLRYANQREGGER